MDAIQHLEACIADIRTWMLTHQLKINDSKTEFLLFGTKQQLEKVNISEIKVGSDVIKPVQSTRNLGVMFDSSLSMRDHVNQVCKKGYHQLTKIRQIKRYMDKPALESVVHSFVTSGMDYCNAVLFGCPTNVIDKLQKLQNCAARVVVGVRKFEHITPVLKELHWLPVTSRINYKIALMVFKCLHGQAPGYLTDLIVRYEPVRNLRSSKNNDLCVPKTKEKPWVPELLHMQRHLYVIVYLKI